MEMPKYKRVFLVTNRHADTYGAIGAFRCWVAPLGMVVLTVGAINVAYFPDEIREVWV
jgi:hypothetical protein